MFDRSRRPRFFPQHTRIFAVLVGIMLLPEAGAAGTKVQTLKEVVQQAVLTQPEVQFRWHAYLAADKEQDVAKGGYFPKLDYTTGRGKETRSDPVLVNNGYTRNSSSLALTQMIYDGFFTRNEVRRLDHARMTRLFELHDVSETTALEALRAYLDVLRYRQLVTLAEDNYVRHRSVLDQIQLKVKAGVGRRVDLEQATGRYALAQSNLLIEVSNLHDVTARFERLVGMSPAQEMEEPGDLKGGLPADATAAQVQAQIYNPALRASIENVRAADYALSGRSAAYQPRMDLRLRQDRGDNLNGIAGLTDNRVAEVVVSWNLFNGLADYNRSRQFAEQLNVAKDLRDKTCRDNRQTLAIAYNDTRKLTEQLTYLDQHQLSIEKARDAYRKQFDIGQRTLLDVLDTENELFQARRNYVIAEYDLKLAYARVHAAIGNLFEVIGLSRVDDATREQVQRWAVGEDGAQMCPPEAPTLFVADKQELNERAAELLRESAPAAILPSATLSVIPPKTSDQDALAQAVKAWIEKRKATLEQSGNVTIEVSEPLIEIRDATHATVTLQQTYRSGNNQGSGIKTLEFEKVDDKWTLVGEMATSKGKAPTQSGKKKAGVPVSAAPEAAPAAVQSTASSGAGDAQAIQTALNGWANAWQEKNVDAYLASYAKTFIPADGSERATWEARRRNILEQSGTIVVEVGSPQLEMRDSTHAVTTFRQNYRSPKLQTKTQKTLEWEKIDGTWQIVGEMVPETKKSAR